jgi:hypothetical protein
MLKKIKKKIHKNKSTIQFNNIQINKIKLLKTLQPVQGLLELINNS